MYVINIVINNTLFSTSFLKVLFLSFMITISAVPFEEPFTKKLLGSLFLIVTIEIQYHLHFELEKYLQQHARLISWVDSLTTLVKQNYNGDSHYCLRRISTGRYDRRFRREVTTKLIRHETIFNFHMNNSGRLLKTFAIKNKFNTFKNV